MAGKKKEDSRKKKKEKKGKQWGVAMVVT